jgi:putative ubiquitin-RnfH superfamily antitoxin RatB of RatAB toxin-antitoxin module
MSSREPAVEVVYALPGRQRVVRVELREGMTAQEAVRASGLTDEFPEIGAGPLLLGIFGRRVEGKQPLKDGDRVEIYRQLKFDPRDARRRAAHEARTARQAGSSAGRR